MKKKIFALCAVVIMFVLTLGVCAESDYYRLQDLAEILTESENAHILAKLDEVSERQGVDIVILTVDAPEEGLTVEEDATEWYEFLEFGKDGVMLYISLEDRDWYVLTSGFGITALTDAGIDYISDKFVEYLSEGDYSGAFDTFIQYTDEFITQAKTGKPYDVGNMPKEPYNIGMSLVISVIIGIIVSAIITGMWKGQLKSVALQSGAATYMKNGSLYIADARDLFLYRTLNRVERKTESGGSSTHRSSSGNTYGGRGGKF